MAEKNRGNVKSEGVVRWLLVGSGLVSLGLGILGIFLPILPTTPFLLLSAYCFGKSSPRLHRWMLTNRVFGEYLRNYKDKKGVPLKVKVFTLTLLWATILFSAFVAINMWWLRILLIFIAVCVTTHLVRIKTYRKDG